MSPVYLDHLGALKCLHCGHPTLAPVRFGGRNPEANWGTPSPLVLCRCEREA